MSKDKINGSENIYVRRAYKLLFETMSKKLAFISEWLEAAQWLTGPKPRVASQHVASGWRELLGPRPGPWLASVERPVLRSRTSVHDFAWQRGLPGDRRTGNQAWEFPSIENVTWTLIYQSQPITFSVRGETWRAAQRRHDFQYFLSAMDVIFVSSVKLE